MGGLRISCQSQDMIFWDEMPHSLGTYILGEPASFIFCWEGGGSGFLQNVNNNIKWFDCWDFDDTFATENQSDVTSTSLHSWLSCYEFSTNIVIDSCDTHESVSYVSVLVVLFKCGCTVVTGTWKQETYVNSNIRTWSSHPIEVYYAWFQTFTVK
jgi:hypothetical protein